jgi:hypothetical protein
MTHLILHRFGSKKIGNQIQPDFNIEETENNGKRQYIFGIDLDHNEIDVTTKKEKPNTSIMAKIENKTKEQVKIILGEKPKSETFCIKDNVEIYDMCPCCTDKIIQKCIDCKGHGNCPDNTCTMKDCKIVGHNI